jgi:hypothetical protein
MKLQVIVFLAVLGFKAFACSPKPISGIDLATGKIFSTESNSKTKGLVVLFLSAKCPCSRSHEKSIEALAKEFSDFSFVGVHSNQDEEEGLASLHFREAGFSFPVIQDRQAKIANDFGALKTPHAFIVGPKGECWFSGGVDDKKEASKATQFYLKQALLDLKAGREPKDKTVRTLGCTIKRG